MLFSQRIVYGVFASAAAAEAAASRLRQENPVRTIGVHAGPRLEGDHLPEAATEFGRNVWLAMGIGAVAWMVAGAVAGALDLLLGVGIGMGVILGLALGLLMGFVGAIQAGTRIAKAPLRAAAASLPSEQRLMIAEVDGRADRDTVLAALDELSPEVLDVC